MKRTLFFILLTCACVGSTAAVRWGSSDSEIARGKYLVQIAGCNDCHTAGYANSGGNVPEEQWLRGDTIGWYGPWGTTYPANLRLSFRGFTEETWIQFARNFKSRPPMPWYALRDMSEADLKAIYRYVYALGPAGEAAPSYLPPGQQPKPPFFELVTQ